MARDWLDGTSERGLIRDLSSMDLSLSELLCQGPPKLYGSSSNPPTVLSHAQLIQLRRVLPARFSLSDWVLLFATDQHGCSLRTFYSRLERAGATVLVVLDNQARSLVLTSATPLAHFNASLNAGPYLWCVCCRLLEAGQALLWERRDIFVPHAPNI